MASDLIRDEDYRSASQTLKQVADGVLPKHSTEAKAAFRLVGRFAKQSVEILGLKQSLELSDEAKRSVLALYQLTIGAVPVSSVDPAVALYHDALQAARAYLAASPVSLREGRLIVRECGSYGRLPAFLEIADRMARRDALRLLGEIWSICDNISEYAFELEWWLVSTQTQPAMMSPAERKAFAALPEIVTVYRGADRGVNEDGVCWSLDRSIAERFPFLMRYKAARPVLVTGAVPKSLIVALKLDREESEIISTDVDVVSVVDLIGAS